MYVRTYVPMLGTHKSTGVHIVECLRDSASQQWNKRVCREAALLQGGLFLRSSYVA